jgi:hypothetical protein
MFSWVYPSCYLHSNACGNPHYADSISSALRSNRANQSLFLRGSHRLTAVAAPSSSSSEILIPRQAPASASPTFHGTTLSVRALSQFQRRSFALKILLVQVRRAGKTAQRCSFLKIMV